MSSLKPIKLLPTRERVASALRKAILTRELKEGENITLDGIATQLGVSNTPVREAFQILASEGLIKLTPNKGAVVTGLTEKMIRDHYITRAILEREAIGMVCQQRTDISDIVEAFEEGQKALLENRSYEYSNFNQAFHMAIWEAAGNERIKTILQTMWNGLSMGHKVTEDAYAQISNSEHSKLVEAIKAYDEEKAKQLMYAHIIRSMENILTHFVQDHEVMPEID